MSKSGHREAELSHIAYAVDCLHFGQSGVSFFVFCFLFFLQRLSWHSMGNRLEIGWSKEIIDLHLCDMVKGTYRPGQ